jgi:hypothetical protein
MRHSCSGSQDKQRVSSGGTSREAAATNTFRLSSGWATVMGLPPSVARGSSATRTRSSNWQSRTGAIRISYSGS